MTARTLQPSNNRIAQDAAQFKAVQVQSKMEASKTFFEPIGDRWVDHHSAPDDKSADRKNLMIDTTNNHLSRLRQNVTGCSVGSAALLGVESPVLTLQKADRNFVQVPAQRSLDDRLWVNDKSKWPPAVTSDHARDALPWQAVLNATLSHLPPTGCHLRSAGDVL